MPFGFSHECYQCQCGASDRKQWVKCLEEEKLNLMKSVWTGCQLCCQDSLHSLPWAICRVQNCLADTKATSTRIRFHFKTHGNSLWTLKYLAHFQKWFLSMLTCLKCISLLMYTEHACVGVNRKQVVYSKVGCLDTENTTDMVNTTDFFAWTDTVVELLQQVTRV